MAGLPGCNESPTLIELGEVYPYTVDMRKNRKLLKAGHSTGLIRGEKEAVPIFLRERNERIFSDRASPFGPAIP